LYKYVIKTIQEIVYKLSQRYFSSVLHVLRRIIPVKPFARTIVLQHLLLKHIMSAGSTG